MKKQGKVIQQKKLYNQFEKDVVEIAGNFVKEFTGTREKEPDMNCDACGHWDSMHADDDICYSCKPLNQVCGKTN